MIPGLLEQGTTTTEEERHGAVYKEWYAKLAEQQDKVQEIIKLKAYQAKLATGTAIPPAEQAEVDAIVAKLQEATKVVQRVERSRPTTPDEKKAVQPLPPFVRTIIAANDINDPAATPESIAKSAPLIYSLLHHTLKTPQLNRVDRMEDLIKDIYRLKDVNKDLAGEVLSKLAEHSLQRGLKLSDQLEVEVDTFLNTEGLEKKFENRPTPNPQAQKGEIFSMPEIFELLNQALVHPGASVDWDVYHKALMIEAETPRREKGGQSIIDRKLSQLLGATGTAMSSRERVMLVALDHPKSFQLVVEALKSDQEFIDRVKTKFPGVSGADLETKIMSELSQDFTKFVMKSVVELHTVVLKDKKLDKSFAEQSSAKSGKDPYNNPELNSSNFIEMLQKLQNNTEGVPLPADLKFSIIRDKILRVFDKKAGYAKEITLPVTEEVPVSVSEFAEYLKGIFETSRGALSFGYDLRFSIENVEGGESQEGTKTYYGAIDGYAKGHFSSRRIDTVFRMPNSELVQAACMAYKSIFMQMLYDHGHRASMELVREQLVTYDSPIDKQIRDELELELAEGKLEPWEVEWAFNLARTQFYGMAFGFHEALSYADPDLKDNGKSLRGAKYGYRGLLNPMFGALEWNDVPGGYYTGGGTAFCPMDMDWRFHEWDHQKVPAACRDMWYETFQMGQAAYRGSFVEGQRLFIDAGSSLIGAGGIYTNGGEGFRRMYDKWLYEKKLLDAVSGGELKDPIAAWKHIENIGIDVIRNFGEQFILKDKKGALFAKLAPYLFDRYFTETDGSGKSKMTDLALNLLADFDIKDKATFDKALKKILDEEKPSFKTENMTIFLKAVETVMIAEQMPTTFVVFDKKRDSEYGMQLGTHIEMDLVDANIATDRTVARDIFNKAIRDISFVERRGRMESIREMDSFYQAHGNLFGDDLDSIRSAVRGGKGNVIDRDYIKEVLCNRYKCPIGNPSTDVERALFVYDQLMARLVKVPSKDDLERNDVMAALLKEKSPRGKAVRRALADGDFRSHAVLLRDNLQENRYGHSITSGGVSNKHLHFTSNNANAVSVAAQMAGISSETVQIKMRDSTRTLLKEVGTAGMENIGKAVEVMTKFWGFKGAMAGYGMDNKPVTNFVLRFITTCLMDDDKVARSFIQRAGRWSTTSPKALVDTLFTKAQVKSWSYLDRKKVTDILRSPAIGLFDEETASDKIKYRTIPKGSPLAKLPGVRRLGKRLKIRDIPNEFTAESFRLSHKAEEKNIIRYHLLPLFMMLFFLMALMAGKKGTEDMKLA